jgi:hypothetical protein
MKRNAYFFPLIMLASFFASCIGTDFVDEPLGPVPSQIALSNTALTLLEGESQQLTAQVIASDGNLLDDPVSWSSRNATIATVDPTGLLNAISSGQTWIDVSTQTLEDSILLTVSVDPNALALVTITNDTKDLSIGDMLQLEVQLSSTNGTILTDKTVTWESTNPEICSVNESGLVTALANGGAQIIASAEGINSVPFPLMVGSDSLSRSGTFQGLNGYNVEGTTTLERAAAESVVVLEDDFKSQSGPGLYVYLSPNANNVNGGVSLGELQATSGKQNYPIPANINLDGLDHVIIYCKPFGVPFGTAKYD